MGSACSPNAAVSWPRSLTVVLLSNADGTEQARTANSARVEPPLATATGAGHVETTRPAMPAHERTMLHVGARFEISSTRQRDGERPMLGYAAGKHRNHNRADFGAKAVVVFPVPEGHSPTEAHPGLFITVCTRHHLLQYLATWFVVTRARPSLCCVNKPEVMVSTYREQPVQRRTPTHRSQLYHLWSSSSLVGWAQHSD